MRPLDPRRILLWAIRWVMRRPNLTRRLDSALHHLPGLRESLLGTASRGGLFAEPEPVLDMDQSLRAIGDVGSRTATEGRPRLAFVSPLPPVRTGVADYSVELLPALSQHYTIDLICAQKQASDHPAIQGLALRDTTWFLHHVQDYDRILYQIGNSPLHLYMLDLLARYPGVVVLHDFYLGHLYAADYKRWQQALENSHGSQAMDMLKYEGQEASQWHYPANRTVLAGATGIITHSDFCRNLAAKWYGDSLQSEWRTIPHLRSVPAVSDRASARHTLGIGPHTLVVCAFGALSPTKLNEELLNAWSQWRLLTGHTGQTVADTQLVFVGANDPGRYGKQMHDAIATTEGRARVTGFTTPADYRLWLQAADIAVQLRSRSRGETSGALLDCLAAGLPVIYNAHGSAAELPEHAGLRIADAFTDEQLQEALQSLATAPDKRRYLSRRAQDSIRAKHAPGDIARQYYEAIEHFAKKST